jgi:hypothetical protein
MDWDQGLRRPQVGSILPKEEPTNQARDDELDSFLEL